MAAGPAARSVPSSAWGGRGYDGEPDSSRGAPALAALHCHVAPAPRNDGEGRLTVDPQTADLLDPVFRQNPIPMPVLACGIRSACRRFRRAAYPRHPL